MFCSFLIPHVWLNDFLKIHVHTSDYHRELITRITEKASPLQNDSQILPIPTGGRRPSMLLVCDWKGYARPQPGVPCLATLLSVPSSLLSTFPKEMDLGKS